MIGIEPERARETFELPDSLVPLTGLAIGHVGSNPALDEGYAKRDGKARERKPLSEILLKSAL